MDAARAAWSESDWERFLGERLDAPPRVTYGRARHRMVEWTRDAPGARPRLRLSVAFAHAPPEVREAVAAWMRAGKRARRACALLDAWIEEASRQLPPARRTRVFTGGRAHDLAPLAGELCAHELAGAFDAEPRPAVTWGARTGRRARRSLRLGSYDGELRLVRVHPVLDQPAVPRWFVRYILFHELLHAVIPPELDAAGRRRAHPPAYQRRERDYADYDRAQRWQRAHLGELLRSARSGRPARIPLERQPTLFEYLAIGPNPSPPRGPNRP